MTERSVNEIAATAVKVRVALRVEREALRARGAGYAGAANALTELLTEFSDEQLCRFRDLIVASDDVDLEAYNAARHAETK